MVLLIVFTAVAIAAGMLLLQDGQAHLPSVMMLVLVVLVILSIAAYYLTEKIIQPVRAINLEKPSYMTTYEELRPLLQYVKQQHSRIDEQVAELKEKQREFATLTEHMNEGLLVINDQGYILSMNPSAMRILGLQNQEYYENKHILMAKRNLELQRLVDDGLEGYHRDILLELDGRMYQVMTTPVSNTGRTQGLVLLFLDVTEKQQQEQLRREFTANVSHELRTPLTAISGYAEIMMHGLVMAEDIQPFAEKIYKEANRMITLIADIIQLSQLDEAAEQFQWEQVDVSRLAGDIEERLREKAEKNSVTMTVYTEPTVISGIPQVLQEILYNLCDNAIKYNKQGGTVKVSVIRSGGNAVIKVIDTGLGIAPEDQPRVFERFYRADKSHSRLIGGTGLGLSIVKHGVQIHSGEIQLESKQNLGTTITVRLPIVQQNEFSSAED